MNSNTYIKKFFSSLLLTLIFLSLSADILGSSPKTIGVIYSADIQQYRAIHKSMLNNLRNMGVDMNTVRFVEQKPYPDIISWSNAVRKLLAYDSDIILAYGAGAARAALKETSSIPVVYASVYTDGPPAFKSGNVTGCSYRVSMSSFLRYLRKAKDIGNLAILYSPFESDSAIQYERMRDLSSELSMKFVEMPVRNAADIDTFLKLKSYDAVVVTGSSLANLEMPLIYELSMKKGVPVVTLFDGTEEYAFLTISADTEMQGAETARLLQKILRGEKAGQVSPVSVTHTNVTLNMRITSALGLKVPLELVTGAERVIR